MLSLNGQLPRLINLYSDLLSYQSSLCMSSLAVLLRALVMRGELPINVPLYRLETSLIEVLTERKHRPEDVLVLGARRYWI